MRWAIATDLDGTLLDAETYAWQPAWPTLLWLGQQGISVVPCTSKTLAETDHLMREMGLEGPRIVESGAAIVLAGETIVLGRPYAEIRAAFVELDRRFGRVLRGFGDMDLEEIVRRTGLTPEDAERARRREYDEPFVIESPDPGLAERVSTAAAELGLRTSSGGRFWHLHGTADKGGAIATLRGRMEPARWIGLGDAPGDIALLLAVDVPIAVPRPSGTVAPELLGAIPDLRIAPHPGPHGWAEAVRGAIRGDP